MTFTQTLLNWYSLHGRALPWRGESDPYRIWISEIILQQTRVEQGKDYYLRFVEQFPTVRALAEAPEEQVLKCWQGLGYYSRARNLHAAAKQIMERHGGLFPSSHEDIRALKGIGPYTAAAIASLAFRLCHPVIDGNVYRFASRRFGLATPIGTPAAHREFEALLARHIDQQRPDLFNQAMMDFGAMVCVPAQPQCGTCPFAGECEALRHGKVELLPVKNAKPQVKERWLTYYHVEWEGHTLMHQRTGSGIWRGLYEFPCTESPQPLPDQALREQTEAFLASLGADPGQCEVAPLLAYTHKLTHRTIHALFVHTILPANMPPHLDGEQLFSLEEMKNKPISRLIDRYLKEKEQSFLLRMKNI